MSAQLVTVMFEPSAGSGAQTFRAAHVAIRPLKGGWVRVVLMDTDWKVQSVEMLRHAFRVRVEVVDA